MAVLRKDSKGFGLIEVLLIIAITGVIGVGYYVFSQTSSKISSSNAQDITDKSNKEAISTSSTEQSKSEKTTEPYKAVISFNDGGSLTQDQKSEISSKLAEPLSYHHFKNLNIPLKEVTIQKAESQGHTVSYVYAENPETNKFGFVFNANEVRYWQPQLCDHGGCAPYPESLKKAFPANYEAYLACEAAEGDKAKQSSLGCDYVN